MEETVETVGQPKEVPAEEGQCLYDGEPYSVIGVFLFGFVLGLIFG